MPSFWGDDAANLVLDATYNGDTYHIDTPWIGLHTASTSTTGANEVSGGSYARLDASSIFADADSAAVASDTIMAWLNMPACTVAYVSVWDSQTGGMFVRGGALDAPVTVAAGNTFSLPVGDFADALS